MHAQPREASEDCLPAVTEEHGRDGQDMRNDREGGLRAQACPSPGAGVPAEGHRRAALRAEVCPEAEGRAAPVAWLRRTPPDGYALRRACNLRLFRRRYQRHISRETKVDKGGAYPISCKSAGSNCPNR